LMMTSGRRDMSLTFEYLSLSLATE
jgi:hypothetical protein